MLKRFGIVAVVLVVLVAGLAGIVWAQDSTPAPAEACPFGGACGESGTYGPGMGGYGMGGRGMMGAGYAGSMPTLLAEALGLTVEELAAAQTDGQTVAEIAAAQGVALADVVAAVTTPHAERLAQAVADGALTQEQADAMLATMTEHMTLRFESQGTGYGGGCGMWGRDESGPSGDTGTFGGWGHRGGMGGMRGGRWSAPQAPGTDL